MCFTYQTKTRGRAIGMVRTSVQKVSLASCERGERIARGLGPSPYRPQPRSVWCTEGHLLGALCLPRGPPLLAGTCPALSATSGPPAGTLLVLPSSFSCKRLKCRRTPQSLPSPSPLHQLSAPLVHSSRRGTLGPHSPRGRVLRAALSGRRFVLIKHAIKEIA